MNLYPGGGSIKPWLVDDWDELFTFIFLNANLRRLFWFYEKMDLTKLSSFCGVFYFHGSTVSRFMTSLQVSLGFSSSTIGDIIGVMRILTSIISPTISAFADTNKLHRSMVMGQSILRILPFLFMWYFYHKNELSVTSYWILNGCISLLGTGIGPMSDALVLASLDDKSRYGQVRLWGALTYGLGNLVLGILIQIYGDFSPMFGLSLITLVPAVASVYFILPPFASETKPAINVSITAVYRLLTHSTSVKIFFLNSIVIGAALSLVESLLFVAMDRAMNGSTPMIAGASVLVSVLFEIPIFQAAPSLINRWGTKRMLIVANVAWIIRALGYSIFSSAWIVLILEVFHGITFGLYFSAAVHVCVKQSPPGMDSTMQALLDMTFNGLGVGIGTIGGGYLFDSIGSSKTFLLFSLGVSVSSLATFKFFKDSDEHGTGPGTENSHELSEPISLARSTET